MRHDAHPTPVRAAGLAATATTLVALMAMSATMAAGPTPRGLGIDRSESHVVRAVAAAVAAAARDLLAPEHGTSAVALLADSRGGDEAAPLGAARPVSVPRPPVLLGERLLDLPPPAC